MMKYLFIIFLLTSVANVSSQDIILKKNGKTIESKIDEIGKEEIKYRKYSNLSGPIYIISKKEITSITFENGEIEVFDIENNSDINEIKKTIIEDINEYCFQRDSYNRTYKAFFEGDYLWLETFNTKGRKEGDKVGYDYIYDLSLVYKFAGVSKREEELAFINIWTSLMIDRKKNKWKKDKLVMRVYGHKNADRIMNSIKEYNRLLNEEN